MEESFKEIGKIVRLKGLKGECVVYLYNHLTLDCYHHLWYRSQSARWIALQVLHKKPYRENRALFLFETFQSQEKASDLVGNVLFISQKDLPPLNPEDFYYEELLEVEVYQENDYLGKVVHIDNFGGGDLMEIEHPVSSKRFFLPILKMYIKDWDLKNKRIVYYDYENLL